MLTIALLAAGCSASTPVSQLPVLQSKIEPFEVHWPPLDPDVKPTSTPRPLLKGELAVAAEPSVGGSSTVRAAVTIVRPSAESDRAYWNKSLGFADIAWMSEVRVWDVDQKWLWPNLPFIFRLPGKERVERYGGVDPGKQVDNDFAAVLIRKFDAVGLVESAETKDSPLVSAEWHSVDAPRGDARSIRHAARSDEFFVHVGGPNEPSRGKLKVWLIYADFLEHRPPPSWPRTPEYAGGILAYFEIDWETADGPLRASVRHLKPTTATDFDWATWVRHAPGDEEATAPFRLSNR
jgi:hypothetical protein